MRIAKFFYKVASPIYQYYQKKQVENRFPFLRNSGQKFREITIAIRPKYEQYVKEVSTPDMAVSLRTAVFLWVLCEGLKPKRILDLGSGFSSFILRFYAASKNDVAVWSVDNSTEWLYRTQASLVSHNLSTARLMLWDQFERDSSGRFDFIFHDLGNMDLRRRSLHLVLKLGEEGYGIVLLDDMHKNSYSEYVRDSLSHYSCRYFDLTPYTLDEFGRYCGLVSDIRKTHEL